MLCHFSGNRTLDSEMGDVEKHFDATVTAFICGRLDVLKKPIYVREFIERLMM